MNGLFSLQSQRHWYWWPGDAWGQIMSSHCIGFISNQNWRRDGLFNTVWSTIILVLSKKSMSIGSLKHSLHLATITVTLNQCPWYWASINVSMPQPCNHQTMCIVQPWNISKGVGGWWRILCIFNDKAPSNLNQYGRALKMGIEASPLVDCSKMIGCM